jgi:hypothetical protein
VNCRSSKCLVTPWRLFEFERVGNKVSEWTAKSLVKGESRARSIVAAAPTYSEANHTGYPWPSVQVAQRKQ